MCHDKTLKKNILDILNEEFWIISDQEFWIEFAIVKTNIVMTMFLGFLCLRQMSSFYSLNEMNKYHQDFEPFFMDI